MINSLDAHISKKKGKTEKKKRSHLFIYNFPFFSIHSKYDFSLFSLQIAYERKRAGCLFVSFQLETNVYERASSFSPHTKAPVQRLRSRNSLKFYTIRMCAKRIPLQQGHTHIHAKQITRVAPEMQRNSLAPERCYAAFVVHSENPYGAKEHQQIV